MSPGGLWQAQEKREDDNGHDAQDEATAAGQTTVAGHNALPNLKKEGEPLDTFHSRPRPSPATAVRDGA